MFIYKMSLKLSFQWKKGTIFVETKSNRRIKKQNSEFVVDTNKYYCLPKCSMWKVRDIWNFSNWYGWIHALLVVEWRYSRLFIFDHIALSYLADVRARCLRRNVRWQRQKGVKFIVKKSDREERQLRAHPGYESTSSARQTRRNSGGGDGCRERLEGWRQGHTAVGKWGDQGSWLGVDYGKGNEYRSSRNEYHDLQRKLKRK